jgi:hypothetical protein
MHVMDHNAGTGRCQLSHGLGTRGSKNPGCPPNMVIHELVALRALRKTSPSGVNGQIFRSVISSQNVRKRLNRWSGTFPAMIAALIAPIETPETQSGSIPRSCSA